MQLSEYDRGFVRGISVGQTELAQLEIKIAQLEHELAQQVGRCAKPDADQSFPASGTTPIPRQRTCRCLGLL